MITVLHWHIGAETCPGSEVVSAVIFFLSSFWLPLLTRHEQRGCHMTWINLNELLASRLHCMDAFEQP